LPVFGPPGFAFVVFFTSALFSSRLSIVQSFRVYTVTGVGNKPNSFPLMWCADACSRKYKRLYFVPLSLQIGLHLLEDQPGIPTNKAANVFAHDPARA
jgi:hypothetical protein